jgi:predicted RNA binding protein YcfA (HicA-like mRNA interferase family)
VSQRGSHQKFKKASPRGGLVVIVPDYREIAEGTFKSILDQARMTRPEFEELL